MPSSMGLCRQQGKELGFVTHPEGLLLLEHHPTESSGEPPFHCLATQRSFAQRDSGTGGQGFAPVTCLRSPWDIFRPLHPERLHIFLGGVSGGNSTKPKGRVLDAEIHLSPLSPRTWIK